MGTLLALTVQQVAGRSGVGRATLRKLEHGELNVGFEQCRDVARIPGLAPQLKSAFDRYETDVSRARANGQLTIAIRIDPDLSSAVRNGRDAFIWRGARLKGRVLPLRRTAENSQGGLLDD